MSATTCTNLFQVISCTYNCNIPAGMRATRLESHVQLSCSDECNYVHQRESSNVVASCQSYSLQYKCNSVTIMNTTQSKSHMQHSCSHTCNSLAVIHATVDARCHVAGFAHKRVRSRSHTCNSITVLIATTGTNVCQVMLLHVVACCCSYKFAVYEQLSCSDEGNYVHQCVSSNVVACLS